MLSIWNGLCYKLLPLNALLTTGWNAVRSTPAYKSTHYSEWLHYKGQESPAYFMTKHSNFHNKNIYISLLFSLQKILF